MWDSHLGHQVQSGSGAHLIFYSTSIASPIAGSEWPERECNHLPPSSVQVTNAESFTSMSS
jgi:hypothetical protein